MGQGAKRKKLRACKGRSAPLSWERSWGKELGGEVRGKRKFFGEVLGSFQRDVAAPSRHAESTCSPVEHRDSGLSGA
jgi:hypothetical protein